MLRQAKLEDVPQILQIYAPYILHTTFTFEYEVPTLEQFRRRFLDITRQFPWLVWEEDGLVLGYAYADRAFSRAAYQWTADLSVYLRPEAKGKGIGRKLYEAAEDVLRRQGYFAVYGIVTDSNLDSCAFHRAMGYQEIAHLPRCGYKLNEWHGIYWFEKRLREGEPEHPPTLLEQNRQHKEGL